MSPKHPWLGLLAFLVLCFAAAGIGGGAVTIDSVYNEPIPIGE